MAQETAGTIGIPVLKNEILPYLTDYAKRQERAELYKQKAAAAAAQKAAKEAEYVPEFKSAPGFGYKRLTKQKQDEAMARALAVVKDQSVPRSEAKRVVGEENLNIQYYGKQDEQLEKEALNELANINKNTYYTAPSSAFYEWADKQPDYQPTTAFRSAVLSRPEYIDFGKINKKSKDFGMEDLTVEEGGKTQRIRVSKLYNYDLVDNPNDLFGPKVPKIKEVNGAEAQKFIESDPELESAYTQWSKNKKNELMAANPTLSDADAEKASIDEFMKRAFPGGEIKYGQTWDEVRASRSRSGAGRKPAYTSGIAGPRAHEFEIGEGEYEVEDVFYSGDYPTSFTSEKSLNAGIRVFPLGSYEEFKDTSIFGEKATDGSLPTKAAFKFKDAVETKLPIATSDISYTDAKGRAVTIPTGREIQPSRVLEIEKLYRGKATPIKRRMGYEITGTIGGKRIYGFVPEEYAADLKNEIAAQKGIKVSPKKTKGRFPK